MIIYNSVFRTKCIHIKNLFTHIFMEYANTGLFVIHVVPLLNVIYRSSQETEV